MKVKVVSRMYATPLTWYSNRRVQHGKLHGSKIHHFPRRASRRPQSSKSIDILPKVTKLQPRETAAGRSASLRGRQTAKLSYDASGQGRKEVQSKCHLPESNHPPPPSRRRFHPTNPPLSEKEFARGRKAPRIFAPLSISIAHFADRDSALQT